VGAEARARLTGYSLAERGYALVRALPAVRTLPGWRLADHVGASIGAVLARRSARSLADPVPGLYTAAGARETVLPAIGRTAAELAGEGWVLGQPMDPAALIQRTRQWRQGITAAYFDDYGRQWQQFMADLTMEPAGAPARLLEQLDAVAGPDSALPRLIAAVVEQSQLVPPAPPGPQAGPPGQTSAAQLGLTAGNTVVTAIQPSAGDDDPASWWPAAAEVSARLQALAVLLLPGTPSNPAPLGAALAALTDLRQALGHWVTPPSIARPGAARSAAETEVRHAADRVKAQAQPLPAPVAGWFTGLADAAVRTLTTRPGAAP
jgi:type VI secretion system protein ImpL